MFRLTEANLEASLGMASINTVQVNHRVQCFGIVLRHTDGWSLAYVPFPVPPFAVNLIWIPALVRYSGDTMPCDALVQAGKDATVLIHEATMGDDEAELALAKAHSTFGQAIDIGRR